VIGQNMTASTPDGREALPYVLSKILLLLSLFISVLLQWTGTQARIYSNVFSTMLSLSSAYISLIQTFIFLS
jgi:hypothetical protein